MKKYIKPTISVVELQAKENMAANPIAVTVKKSADTYTTTYNLALLGNNSNFNN